MLQLFSYTAKQEVVVWEVCLCNLLMLHNASEMLVKSGSKFVKLAMKVSPTPKIWEWGNEVVSRDPILPLWRQAKQILLAQTQDKPSFKCTTYCALHLAIWYKLDGHTKGSLITHLKYTFFGLQYNMWTSISRQNKLAFQGQRPASGNKCFNDNFTHNASATPLFRCNQSSATKVHETI